MQNFPRNALFLATLLACAAVAHAEDAKPAAPAAPAGPTFSDILTNSGIEVKGYLDVAAEGTDLKTGGNGLKVFDTEHTGLGLHQFGLTVDKLPKEGFGGLVNITAGKDAKPIASYGTTASQFDLTQAFVQYAGGPVTVIAGKFVTLAGAEVIDSSANTNFSRSILFGSIPFTHTGLRLTYGLNDTTNLIAGINNGWDQVSDFNTQKTVELGITANPVKPLTIAASVYTGVEPVLGTGATMPTPAGTKTLFDLVATYAASEKLTLIANFDYVAQENMQSLVDGSIKTANYSGIALYANYAIDDNSRLSLRGEYLDDKDGYRSGDFGTSHNYKEVTLTYGYAFAKNFELRSELRYDQADKQVFIKQDGSTTKNGATVAFQGIYKF